MDATDPRFHGPRAAEDLAAVRDELRSVVLDRAYERREQPFQLSSGGFSQDYVDLRRAVARGEDLELAGRAVAGSLAQADVEYDVIGGMTMGADPVAHAVAMLTGCSWYSVRKAPKEHGTGRRTEGAALAPGVRTVLFEDTVSTGRSLLDALDVVRATGADIVAACTILDRGEGLASRLASESLTFVRVLTYADLGLEPL
jgi:orotate phosphoribosyltransferase